MNIRLLISAVTVLVSAQALFAAPKTRTLQSPDGRLAVTVEVGEAVTYSIALDGHTFILPSPVSMNDSLGRQGAGKGEPVIRTLQDRVRP